MRIKFKYPNHRAVRMEASEILAVNANRLKLIEALCLSLLVVPLYLSVQALFAAFAYEFVMIPSPVWMWIEKTTVFFVTLLITIPLGMGVFGMAEKMERGEETLLPDLFLPFSSWLRYVKSVWLAWKIMWLPALLYFLLWGGIELCNALIVNEKDLRMTKIYLCGGVIAIGAFLIMCLFGLTFLGIRGERAEGSAARFSKASHSTRFRGCDRFLGLYLWRIFLGLLSVGIYLLMDVLPEMLVAYFRYCRYLNDNDDTSEEKRDE